MPEFQQVRDKLADGRSKSEEARLAIFAGEQRIRMLEKERTALNRQEGGNNQGFHKRLEEIETQIAHENELLVTKRSNFETISTGLLDAELNFKLFIDPRIELANHFSNETPFMLFPLRLETRFKTVDNVPQLWVRVYPDECLVDTFEPLLSQKEVNNAARFWGEFYSAGKIPDPANPDAAALDLQKAAWRLLVGAHGDGRAAWIAKQLVPDEALSVFPVRGPQTVILSIVSDSWNNALLTVITGLFSKLWFASGNEQLIKQTKEDFNTANPGLDAQDIITRYEPVNFNDTLPQGLKREDADLQFAIVVFPGLETKAGKEQSWSQPSTVRLLPERLALIRIKNNKAMEPVFGEPIPFPLPISPDPSVGEDGNFKQDANKDLEFAEPIKWLSDFDRAVQWGMGFRITLAADELNGFDKLLVLGVKLGADATEGKKRLEELFDHHFYTKKGFSIIPQGTPTNNTGSADSGYSNSDHADETFDHYFRNIAGFEETNERNERRDGQWLAEWLGLEYDVFKKVLHSGGKDQMDAMNMNTALWPATLGYVMTSVMEDGFEPATIELTRNFFNAFVSGRGPVPAIRIGNQPYGILPTTAFRRMQWVNIDERFHINRSTANFLARLYDLLQKMETFFANQLLPDVATITKPTAKPGETLLEVLNLHANSVDFFRRYMESLDEINNMISFIGPGLNRLPVNTGTMQFLQQDLGYDAKVFPMLASLLGWPDAVPVIHMVDDVPLSETGGIRSYTNDNKNYITALVEQARKSQDAVRTGEGLKERPLAELYRLLKYAIEQAYHASAIDAVADTNVFTQPQLATMKLEQPFVHQQWKGNVTESRYSLLYSQIDQLSSTSTVSEFVRDSIFLPVIPPFSRYLSSLINSLELLSDASTARLERALVEHIDCCSYRLDAWKMGLMNNSLGILRNNMGPVTNAQRNTGIFIGAFGWLENVRPEKNKMLQVKEVPADLVADFNLAGNKTFFTDSANEGYIHAPSLNQAVTAAVLRNGYVSHGKPGGNNVLAVNLTSERVRLALSVIEGIQAGQSLPALLGYHLERELHDREDLKEKSMDSHIYQLRKFFPLNADQLKETQLTSNTDPSVDPVTVPITAIEARNVVHGVRLIDHVKKASSKNYPFGLSIQNNDADIATAITQAVAHIQDIADAVGDLGMAESVHHVLMGNTDRASGVLDSYSKGNYPQEPDVIKSPRSGATITHRVGIPLTYVPAAAGAGPRAQTEPSIDQWLATIIPPVNDIVCECSYISRTDGLLKKRPVSMQEIGLKPIDLLYVMDVMDTRQLNEIDDRLIHFVHQNLQPQIDGKIDINYTVESGVANKFPLFQVMPLLKSLKTLLIGSATLTPGDVALPNEALKKDVPAPELNAQRVLDLVKNLKDYLTNDPTGILAYFSGLPAKDAATPAQLQNILDNIDGTINNFAQFLLELSRYGIPQTGSGSLYVQRQQWFTALKSKLQPFITRWQTNAGDYALLELNPPLPENLQAMERLIAATADPIESITPASVNAKKILFNNAFTALQNTIAALQPTLIKLVQDINALSIAPFDLTLLDIKTELTQVIEFVYDLQARAQSLIKEITTVKLLRANAILGTLGTLSLEDQAKQLEAAARIILGDAFRMVPRYTLQAAQQAEIANSWNAKSTLLNHSKTTDKRTNPQEDWLHGIARVHEKMKHLENCILMREAFDMDESLLTIHPVQLPFKTEKYHWLALPYPVADVDLEKSNVLLYTAFTNEAATAPTDICGLLADEWIELIPATEEPTGLTFHYDRPNCEAPQTILLVTPTSFKGNWQWNDLVDALLYTLDAAKMRAINPDQIDNTPLGSLLPAVIAAESMYPYSIVLDNPLHYMTVQSIINNDQPNP